MSENGKTYLRPLRLLKGGMSWVRKPECRCKDRHGPNGGVCGNCGDAIPSAEERRKHGHEGSG